MLTTLSTLLHGYIRSSFDVGGEVGDFEGVQDGLPLRNYLALALYFPALCQLLFLLFLLSDHSVTEFVEEFATGLLLLHNLIDVPIHHWNALHVDWQLLDFRIRTVLKNRPLEFLACPRISPLLCRNYLLSIPARNSWLGLDWSILAICFETLVIVDDKNDIFLSELHRLVRLRKHGWNFP